MSTKLRVEAISHRFPATEGLDLSVLENVSFDIRAGEFVSIIGASGSGKTTLLRILANLTRPTSGRVLIDGEQPKDPSSKMAIVFQRDSLWPWRSVLDNALYGLEIKGVPKREARAKAQKYLDMVGLGSFGSYYPHQLSGGMRQRVNLARALTVEPDILLMDEPFSALDSQTREVMQVELTRIWQETGKTIILVTHQLDEAVFLSDRIITLSARPGSVREIVDIDLDRPRTLRTKRTERFQAYVGQHWDLIEHEVMKGFRAEATI